MTIGADIAVIASALTGGIGYGLAWWKSKGEIEKLRWDLSQAKLETETRSLGQLVMLLTENRKVAAGTRSITFSDEDLREMVGTKHAPRLHAALDLLRTKGQAKKAPTPGHWIID